MAKNQLQIVIDLFRTYISEQGWSIREEKEVQNGYQLLVTDGRSIVPIICYTTGNALIQGPTGTLKATLQTWWKQQKTSLESSKNQSAPLWTEGSPLSSEKLTNQLQPSALSSEAADAGDQAFTDHIGTDESGKGDYFGPLVIAGVSVNEQT